MSEKTKLEELQERRASQREAKKVAEREQFEKDYEKLIELEMEHDVVRAVKVDFFVADLPTRAFMRAPNRAEYKRYRDLVNKAAAKKDAGAVTEAADQLAKACWIYPTEKETREAMLDSFPGLLASIAHEATQLAEGKAEEEGKD